MLQPGEQAKPDPRELGVSSLQEFKQESLITEIFREHPGLAAFINEVFWQEWDDAETRGAISIENFARDKIKRVLAMDKISFRDFMLKLRTPLNNSFIGPEIPVDHYQRLITVFQDVYDSFHCLGKYSTLAGEDAKVYKFAPRTQE